MTITGIICEYNPMHLGHQKQIRQIRGLCGDDSAVVCLMSGNFVQRGAPAILDKSLRAQAAVLSGADLVLELPVEYALSSAEGFAAGGVRILEQFCDNLCFGAESEDGEGLMNLAKALLSEEFRPLLKEELESGRSFPAARQAALARMGLDAEPLSSPNNILAVEYCKAILTQNCAMEPLPIRREGCYHDAAPDPENPSATALRKLMLDGSTWEEFAPGGCRIFRGASLHTLAAGERAMLARLRTLSDEAFEALPYGSEGLWRKLMRACRTESTLEEIAKATKSKRYTRSRIDRMLLCAFLGITLEDLLTQPPYVRVLAFTDRGRAVLKQARQTGTFLNAGEIPQHPYWERERQFGDLYGLFSCDHPEPPGAEQKRRIFYHPETCLP